MEPVSSVVAEAGRGPAAAAEQAPGAAGPEGAPPDAGEGGAREFQDVFLAMAAHELRTPLQSLNVNLALMSTRVGSAADEVPREWLLGRLARTQRAADQMRRLIEGLLNVTELVSGRFELQRTEVDLCELVHAVVDRARDALDWAGCRCEVEAGAPVVGRWDRLRLEIVLDNLLGNAIKFAPGRPITVRVRRDADVAVLEVADEGPGIPIEAQERVFARFERLERGAVPGFGLGLWLVRSLARAHGGEVRLASAPGRGAAFTVWLPDDGR